MKKISVIIPCYNIAPWIDRCMASIAVQTIGLDDLEVICIDDASTDGTWEHLQRWERKFPDHILLIRQDVNRRQGAARNLGLQYASAPYIAFVDGDDQLEPDYFEQLYAPIAHHTRLSAIYSLPFHLSTRLKITSLMIFIAFSGYPISS